MKNLSRISLTTIIFLLILLWVYTAASKVQDFSHFKIQMHKQALPERFSTLLIWTLPPTEILVALMLLTDQFKKAGLIISAAMMFSFTGYVGLAVFHVFGKIPCSCGGVLRGMTWTFHFFFNLFFLLLSITGIYIVNRERRSGNS